MKTLPTNFSARGLPIWLVVTSTVFLRRGDQLEAATG